MRGADKFLLGIVAGVVVLVVVVFAIALLRPEAPSYDPDDTPEAVAHNYLLALRLSDYERAYGYLSPSLKGYPATVEKFADDIEDTWSFRTDRDSNISLIVDSVRITGDRAVVSIQRTVFYGGGLFDSGESTQMLNVELRLTPEGWRIVESDRYWDRCWSDPTKTRCE